MRSANSDVVPFPLVHRDPVPVLIEAASNEEEIPLRGRVGPNLRPWRLNRRTVWNEERMDPRIAKAQRSGSDCGRIDSGIPIENGHGAELGRIAWGVSPSGDQKDPHPGEAASQEADSPVECEESGVRRVRVIEEIPRDEDEIGSDPNRFLKGPTEG
jgi:hypothetical protein